MQQQDLSLYQGDTFNRRVLLTVPGSETPLDLTDVQAKMQIRPVPSASNIIFELSTENGRIVIDGLAGSIELTIEPVDSNTLGAGKYAYDLELHYPDGRVKTILAGSFMVTQQVTR